MNDKLALLKRIEELRKELNQATKDKTLSDPEIVLISQSLDKLLTQYHKLISIQNKKNSNGRAGPRNFFFGLAAHAIFNCVKEGYLNPF
ncbi:aspartyl-phosphate phosphatase Spo0E family protein [Aneurinibacillus sp. Ricciae_BoGa-3]|uniref:aspartyl-phosphate phosphatase Spo0E family protein n=1 Tax=Aneurinibacillus sp. Ricciae_BoGa-3 TaxID=3022697 RepID=UPI00234236AF|nr:aspartyl-phosphate phosphatase Spo0E family protein [Aneurinibacillus sp. Ricciae_BoGa-3]WCK55416.1 aspartyl-phosphate phosphatase Spo0E family protein [Aneurinibacillus sp. Ricciae_BoGa-3]